MSDRSDRGEHESETESGSVEGDPLDRPHDIEALRITYEGARTVLDAQLQRITDIDDKAATVLRIDSLLLGLLVTAATLITRVRGQQLAEFVNPLTAIGVGLIVVSLLAAIVTYTISETVSGVGPDGIERRYTEREWLVLLNRSAAAWMRENERANRRNARAMNASPYALGVGVALVVLGIALSTVSP
jgi:hypothetical protein